MSDPVRTGDDAFAEAVGMSRSYAATYRRRLTKGNPEAAENFAAIDSRVRAEAALADLDAARSIDDEDIADFAEEADPVAALHEEVRDRADRRLRAQLGAHASWATTDDPTARTRPAREAFMARFEREVDPEGKLPPAERAERAAHAHKAHMLKMSLASAKARRERKQSRS